MVGCAALLMKFSMSAFRQRVTPAESRTGLGPIPFCAQRHKVLLPMPRTSAVSRSFRSRVFMVFLTGIDFGEGDLGTGMAGYQRCYPKFLDSFSDGFMINRNTRLVGDLLRSLSLREMGLFNPQLCIQAKNFCMHGFIKSPLVPEFFHSGESNGRIEAS